MPRADTADDLRIVEEMLFSGTPRPAASAISIWNQNVNWKTTSTDTAIIADTRDAVADMNSALQGAPFKLVEAISQPPALLIAFVPADKLASMKTARMAFRPGRLGHTFTFRRKDGSIGNAGIFIADNLPEIARRYTLRHELMHAMGIPKHTTYSFDSVLRRNWQLNSAPGTLLKFDRKIIDFVYRYLKPGHTKSDLRRVFGRRWQPSTD
jgi:hypothetical protein